MKTITISDDVYERLLRIKGKKSFSALIDELISKNVEKRLKLLLDSAVTTGHEDEFERVMKEIREQFKSRYPIQ
ncbi:MAG: antitoxin VapB family protein [Candidatus Nitrosocaldus sp.]